MRFPQLQKSFSSPFNIAPSPCVPCITYVGYSINTILYQRGIYDPDTFTTVKKYGLKMFVSTDDGLSTYLKRILKQLTGKLLTIDRLIYPVQGISEALAS